MKSKDVFYVIVRKLAEEMISSLFAHITDIETIILV